MKLSIDLVGGRKVTVERNEFDWVYLTIVDLAGMEMHARLLLEGVGGNEVRALIGLLEVVAGAEDNNGIWES